MPTLEQAAKGMDKRLTKRASTYHKKINKIAEKRSKKGKWDDATEKIWMEGSSWS